VAADDAALDWAFDACSAKLLAALALSVADLALFTAVVALVLADVAEPAAADADCDAEEAFAVACSPASFQSCHSPPR
jgi:hypothetical protein